MDNLLELELVVANGSIVTTNANGTTLRDGATGAVTARSDDASLFWALRGGGGSTWGVLTAITLRTVRRTVCCCGALGASLRCLQAYKLGACALHWSAMRRTTTGALLAAINPLTRPATSVSVAARASSCSWDVGAALAAMRAFNAACVTAWVTRATARQPGGRLHPRRGRVRGPHLQGRHRGL